MKGFITIFIILLSLLCTFSPGADTLYIAPCDLAAVNMFDELICLSQETGTLRRYVDFELQDIYEGDENIAVPILQDPGQPVFDGADLIYLLDITGQNIYAWDRYLNVHSITVVNEDIISPTAFTVTSEHDWLIYDEFYGQILQVLPGENFHGEWGDKPISGEIDLFTIGEYVIVHLIDHSQIRISDANGTTLNEFLLPESIKVDKAFPLQNLTFALASSSGVYIWKPQDDSLRYLSDMNNLIHCTKTAAGYRLISQEGMIVITP